ncbi:uncharacterized protein LOC143188651 [Calliopsis andreniformis]|uniref:uncharacterized protein LOC143188651 n=1 Tax=Calliopsis andreniformis TaxID=337506 RepID=UPI003FCE087C
MHPLACHQADLSSHHTEQQHVQLGHAAAAAAAAAASMGMESSELMAVAAQFHYQVQQLQRQLLAEQSGPPGTMLPPAAQPAGGGLMQSLQQGQQAPQSQGQDPLQSLMQQLICLQQMEYFLAQRGHK